MELARIGFVLVIAALLDRPEREIATSLKLLMAAFALAGVHMLLILKQPYLGGTLVYVPMTLGMLYFAGACGRSTCWRLFFTAASRWVFQLSRRISPCMPQLLELASVFEILCEQRAEHTYGVGTALPDVSGHFSSLGAFARAAYSLALAVSAFSVADCGDGNFFSTHGAARDQRLSAQTCDGLSRPRI